LLGHGPVPLPDAAALDRAALRGQPPLPATDWPRDPAWHALLRALVQALRTSAPAGPVREALDRLATADEVFLERQADALLHGVAAGVDLACAPIIAAALQVYWTHLVLSVQQAHTAGGQPIGQILGRPDEAGLCPACGSRPVASLTRHGGEAFGQRYLHCSLCSLQWHVPRTQCTHCGGTTRIAYQSLDAAEPDADDTEGRQRAARAAVQAETCEDCGHYLKLMHTDRDPFIEPVADDLATLTLDLLVGETGLRRHGNNLMLVFGEPEEHPGEPPPAPPPAGAPPPGRA
jgi:FdhE protein